MFYSYSANLKDGQLGKFQEWACEAEKRFAAAAPEGWRFRGIYLTSFGLGSGQAEIQWDVENYSAFDSAVKVYREGGDYAKAVDEYFRYVDLGSGRARVLRHVADRSLTLARAGGGALAL